MRVQLFVCSRPDDRHSSIRQTPQQGRSVPEAWLRRKDAGAPSLEGELRDRPLALRHEEHEVEQEQEGRHEDEGRDLSRLEDLDRPVVTIERNDALVLGDCKRHRESMLSGERE